jgi:hypothetical protein
MEGSAMLEFLDDFLSVENLDRTFCANLRTY